jgi:acyl carrier protein
LQTIADVIEYLGGQQAAQPAAQPAVQDQGKVRQTLMQVVAEKTGYPEEMLETSMSLDADLGIDSIKRVEILSTLQEALPELPEVNPDVMGSLQTLGDIINYLGDQAPAETPAPVTTVQPAQDDVQQAMFAIVAEKTGYPVDMLEAGMSLDADLGIDSIKRVEILSALQDALPQLPAVDASEMSALQTLGDIADYFAAQAGPVVAAAPTATAGVSSDAVKQALFHIVAEKTGYPEDMLELNMALEGDLGIDSIKRVEILSALQDEVPSLGDIPADEAGSLQSLGDIVNYLNRNQPQSAVSVVATPAPAVAVQEIKPAIAGDLRETLFAIVAEKTGYPADMLENGMHLEADLGIDSIKRVEILSALQDTETALQAVPADEMGSLATLGDILEFFEATTASVSATPVAQQATLVPAPVVEEAARSNDAPVHLYTPTMTAISGDRKKIVLAEGGDIWIAGTGTQLERDLMRQWEGRGFRVTSLKLFKKTKKQLPEKLSGLMFVGLHNDMPRQVLRNALMLLKNAAQSLRNAGQQQAAILASITEMGGHFGFEAFSSEADPQMGALAGMIKTASHEWNEVCCKAIDIASDFDQDPDYRLVEELLLEGPLEVGMLREGAVSVKLQTRNWPELKADALTAYKGQPIVITGGARGVTAATCIALAKAFQPKLILLGRSPEPEPSEPEWLANCNNEGAIKKAIIANSTKKLTPRDVNAACQGYLRAREIRSNLAAMRAAGSEVVYLQADVRETAALNHAIASVEKNHGPIVGLLHGAGVLADKRIEEKTEKQFDDVYGTKVDGLQLLLNAIQLDQLKFVGLFSSTTARLGRKGQVDYAMANEALNKYAQQLRSQYPGMRVVSFNWGPWDGGMVNPGLAALFEAEGIGLIPIEKGAELVAREFSQPTSDASEIVVLAGDPLDTAGDDSSESNIVHRMDISVDEVPVLSSHVLNECAVVPMALSIEWLAQIAIAEHPGYKFAGFENLQVLKGIILAADRKLNLQFSAEVPVRREDGSLAITMMIASEDGAKTLRHVRTTILLAERFAEAPQPSLGTPGEAYSKPMDEVYRMLFHGKMLQGIEEIATYSDEGLTARIQPAPNAEKWWREPLRGNWLCDPMFMDGAFQTMVLWCIERFGVPSLPSSVASLRMFGRFPKEPVAFTVRITGIRGQLVDAAMEFVDASGKLVARLDGYTCVMDNALNHAFRRNLLPETARA